MQDPSIDGLNWMQLHWEHLRFLPGAALQELQKEVFSAIASCFEVLHVTALADKQRMHSVCFLILQTPACPWNPSNS